MGKACLARSRFLFSSTQDKNLFTCRLLPGNNFFGYKKLKESFNSFHNNYGLLWKSTLILEFNVNPFYFEGYNLNATRAKSVVNHLSNYQVFQIKFKKYNILDMVKLFFAAIAIWKCNVM